MVAMLAMTVPASASIDARLQGTFAMSGRITVADHVFGERAGQHVSRIWTFVPCQVDICKRVTLTRQRSARRILDTIVLRRRGPGYYVGRGRFWVALSCQGVVIPHGGVAFETISMRITQVQLVAGTKYATAIRAHYVNPMRKNLTSCPGGIGHDAAKYTGKLSSALP
jgi:hypothetical protein